MKDILGDSLLWVIGGCLLLIFVLCGCLGGPQSKMNGGLGNDVGQEIAGIKAQLEGNRVVAKAVLADQRRFNDARAKQLTQIENSGLSSTAQIIKDVIQGALWLSIVALMLWTMRQMKSAVCRYRVERRLNE